METTANFQGNKKKRLWRIIIKTFGNVSVQVTRLIREVIYFSCLILTNLMLYSKLILMYSMHWFFFFGIFSFIKFSSFKEKLEFCDQQDLSLCASPYLSLYICNIHMCVIYVGMYLWMHLYTCLANLKISMFAWKLLLTSQLRNPNKYCTLWYPKMNTNIVTLTSIFEEALIILWSLNILY